MSNAETNRQRAKMSSKATMPSQTVVPLQAVLAIGLLLMGACTPAPEPMPPLEPPPLSGDALLAANAAAHKAAAETMMASAPEAKIEQWAGNVPMIVIPVTLTRTDFKPALENAIARARRALPSLSRLKVDLVGVTTELPVLPENAERNASIARASAAEVLRVLFDLGIADSDVRPYLATDFEAGTPEIRIYPQEK